MARLPKTSPLGALQGTLGKELVFKQYADKTVVSKYPDMRRVKPTERQKVQRVLMKEANAYAQRILRDPEQRVVIEKSLLPGETVYHKAKKLFFAERKRGK